MCYRLVDKENTFYILECENEIQLGIKELVIDLVHRQLDKLEYNLEIKELVL